MPDRRSGPTPGRAAGPVDDPVVIIGMAVEAPGDVTTPDEYWALLVDEREALGTIPTDRGWAVADLLDGSRRDGHAPICNAGGFLSSAAEFDPQFFGISPREAVVMDPQQRVVLRGAWRALEDAGINPGELSGHDAGVYIGASMTGYGPDMAAFGEHSGHVMAGTALSVISGRVAHTLGLAGPALTVDTSCSSGLVAFHQAVQAIRSGDCDLAITGGVCVMGAPGFFVEFSKQHALSADGHCRPYTAAADGTVWAEGAAMFVLQRRSSAERDGRHSYGQVAASCLNQDGRTPGLMTPSQDAQQRLLRTALARAGLPPDRVGMIEGHGTGTRVGDPVELRALIDVYGSRHRHDGQDGSGPRLGSVKSNLGHAQAAAGALGLAKVLLAAEHRTIPATLHLTCGWNDQVDWGALTPAETTVDWPAIDGWRVGAVSSFGMSGTNAHVLISVPEPAVHRVAPAAEAIAC